MQNIGERVKDLRIRRGLSVKDLSVKAGTKSNVINRLESGQIPDPRISLLKKICEGLGIDISILLLDPKMNIPIEDKEMDFRIDVSRIVGNSDLIKRSIEDANLFSKFDDPVLLTGETGTGKSLFAMHIHYLSHRVAGPFLTINCAGLPDTLAQSELFGYTKGAFTGAYANRQGAFESARGGTIYLDELGAMPLHLQAIILRVLETRLVRRLGENSERPVDCRIIAATNEDLEKSLSDGKFRADLFYRFRFHLHLPPLRERPRDIPLLIEHFIAYDAKRLGVPPKRISEAAINLMLQYPWPGNIRQLESVLDLLMISVEEDEISQEDIGKIFNQYGFEPSSSSANIELFRSQRIPYYFGPPVSDPSRFFGRKNETAKILQLLKQSEFGNFWPVAIIGDHRVGKSSLLRILDTRIPSETKCLSTYIDIASIGEGEFFETIIRRVAELVYSKSNQGAVFRGIKEAVDTRIWKFLLGEVDIDILGFLKLKKKPSSEKDWEDFREILSRLRMRLNDFGRYSSIVIILDEVSACANWEGCSDLLKNWRSYIQSVSGYNFIVADAHPLYQISKDKWSAFFNVFNPILLGGLESNEAEELIRKPAEEVGVTYAPEALARIRELSANKPYYIQVICCCIFEWLLKSKTTSYVSRALVEINLESVLERLSEYFSSLWSTLTSFQKHYLVGLANNHEPELASFNDSTEFEDQRNQLKLLQERQVIAKDQYKITQIEPLLKIWINRYFS